jgi:hypothetical protein
MGSDVEQLVTLYAASLLGVTAVTIAPSVSWEGVEKILVDEGIKALVLAPRNGGEDRFAALPKVFEAELEPVTRTPGYRPFASKRFRSLKYVVCTSNEFADGILRFKDIPVYGESAPRERGVLCLRGGGVEANHRRCW